MSEFEEEKLKEGKGRAALDARVEHIETRLAESVNGQGAAQEPKPSSTNQLKQIVNEAIDKLGPLPDEEIKLIREWLELGSS